MPPFTWRVVSVGALTGFAEIRTRASLWIALRMYLRVFVFVGLLVLWCKFRPFLQYGIPVVFYQHESARFPQMGARILFSFDGLCRLFALFIGGILSAMGKMASRKSTKTFFFWRVPRMELRVFASMDSPFLVECYGHSFRRSRYFIPDGFARSFPPYGPGRSFLFGCLCEDPLFRGADPLFGIPNGFAKVRKRILWMDLRIDLRAPLPDGFAHSLFTVATFRDRRFARYFLARRICPFIQRDSPILFPMALLRVGVGGDIRPPHLENAHGGN